jgi:hypothetical protein
LKEWEVLSERGSLPFLFEEGLEGDPTVFASFLVIGHV